MRTGARICAFAIAGIAALAAPAAADNYPSAPIKLIVPYPACGVTDVAARVFALGDQLGQTVIVENRGGAAGRIGTEAVAPSAPDGYTLLFGNAVTHGSAAASKHLPYDPERDFTPIVPLFWYSSVLVCNPSLPARTIADLIKYAHTTPKPLTYSSAGVGSGNHFMGELFGQMAGVHVAHVPYRGSAPALQDVISGVVDCTFDGQARQAVESGAVRAFATSGRERDPLYPDLPTLQEAGLNNYDLVVWQGLLAPANLPAKIAARLSDAGRAALAMLVHEKNLPALGLNALPGDADTLRQLIAAETLKYRTIAKQAKIEVD